MYVHLMEIIRSMRFDFIFFCIYFLVMQYPKAILTLICLLNHLIHTFLFLNKIF